MKKLLIILYSFSFTIYCAQHRTRTSLSSLPDEILYHIIEKDLEKSGTNNVYYWLQTLSNLKATNKKFASIISLKFIKELLNKYKIDLNPKDFYGNSPLWLCYRDRNFEFDETLISLGAKFYGQASYWKIYFLLSDITGDLYNGHECKLEQEEIEKRINQLIETIGPINVNMKIMPNSATGSTSPLLIHTSKFPRLNNLSIWLIKNGADLYDIDDHKPALYFAVSCYNNELIQPLIDAGSNVNFPNEVPVFDDLREKIHYENQSLLNAALTEQSYFEGFDKLDLNKRKPIIKTLILNGAKGRDVSPLRQYNMDLYPHKNIIQEKRIQAEQLYKNIKDEIIAEYKEKIKKVVDSNPDEKLKQFMELNDDDFIKNILKIRLALNEINEEKYNMLR